MKKIKNYLSTNKAKTQVIKLLYTLVACVGLLLLVECLFQIPKINKLFSPEAISGAKNNVWTWIILWLLMFAQVTIIPIPAMPIYIFCDGTNLVAAGSNLSDLFSLQTLFFGVFVTSASIVGCLLAYWVGRYGGSKAIQWVAGDAEEYDHWCSILNKKGGKIFYACSVLFPIFPDDLLCIVAGAMKFDFKWFFIINTIGKLIGAFCIIIFIRLPIVSDFFTSSRDGGIPISIIAYSVLLVIGIIGIIICKNKLNKDSV